MPVRARPPSDSKTATTEQYADDDDDRPPLGQPTARLTIRIAVLQDVRQWYHPVSARLCRTIAPVPWRAADMVAA